MEIKDSGQEKKYGGSQYSKELAGRIFLNHLGDCVFFPKYLTIETCNSCNARCVMCPKGQKGTEKLQLMEDGLFDKIAKELSFYSDWIEMVSLYGNGEPLLDKGIALKINRMKKIGIKHVHISTNGQLLTKHKAEELLEAGLDDIRVSLDGFTKETFENVRKGLKYNVVKENVLNLIKMRDDMGSQMEIRLRMTELEENVGEREGWMMFWKGFLRTTDKVQLMPMHTWGGDLRMMKMKKELAIIRISHA